MMLFWYFNPNPNPDSLVKQGDGDRRDEVVLARKVLPRSTSLDHPLYRRVAPRNLPIRTMMTIIVLHPVMLHFCVCGLWQWPSWH